MRHSPNRRASTGHATGHAVTWVNSYDALLPGALQRVAEAFTTDPELLVYGGRSVHRTAGSRDRDPAVTMACAVARKSSPLFLYSGIADLVEAAVECEDHH